ncbi:Intraflagellar transport protein 81 [Blyttiomyces sp. JEL0837]|nr:Intraflagellar transport protein 81 [Blyttiomyces sp. JEL0837]
MSSPDLKLVVEKLSQPPFNRNFSVIQLHDELPIPALVQLVTDVAAFLDDTGPLPTIHKVDIRNEEPESTAWRIGDFLRILKYKGAADLVNLRQQIQNGDRNLLLDILYFMIKDINMHKKRAYLATFLEIIDVPPEYLQDDTIMDLIEQVSMQQDQFKETHKYVEGLRQTSGDTINIKREIQQMEEEKQQVLNKIAKIKKKVEQVPNHESWIEAAKNLRLEQKQEAVLAERIREQKNLISAAEKKYAAANQSLKDVRSALITGGPEALLSKMSEECKMNKYLATENLPKAIEETRQRIKDINKVINDPPLSEDDMNDIDMEIRSLNEDIAKLAEKRLLKNNSGDDKLALFRQQAAIIARKKEGTAQRLATLTEEVSALTDELDRKKDQAKGTSGTKLLKGEEFKRYVSELRGKSTLYKRKKAELSELTTEFGILQRTEEILRAREQAMSSTLRELENRSGVRGFHDDKENLEKVSERKSEMDEVKGKTLNEISDIIQTLTATINDKKASLAPVIQELRSLRSKASDLEGDYLDRKRHYDATMVGIDSEAIQLEQEVKGYRQDISNDQSRFHYLSMMIGLTDIAQDRILQEMKAYIGGDDVVEIQQKSRGFKTYRDLYNRKITEQENIGKTLREQQKDIKAKHEPNMKQLAMFNDVKKLLQLKASYNQRVISGGATDTGFEGNVKQITQDRLVL